jgi:hypothetical protein
MIHSYTQDFYDALPEQVKRRLLCTGWDRTCKHTIEAW